MEREVIIAGLRQQHKELLREDYDGHNRHSGITNMRTLTVRVQRRMWNLRMRQVTEYWNSDNNR